MGIEKMTISVVMSFLMATAVQAQEIKTDSIGDNLSNHNEQMDSLKVLAGELAQIKSRLDGIEQERHDEKIWKRKKYWKLGLANTSIERVEGEAMSWDTDFAVFLQRGKTVYFHSKPLWGMVKVGLDYGFVDIGYAKLKLKSVELDKNTTSTFGTSVGANSYGGFDDIISDAPGEPATFLPEVGLGMHKIDYRLHIGPSVSVNPWNHLIVAAYFHVMPTASGIIENDAFSSGFGCALSAGVSVSYNAISVGVEGVWSTIKYTQASFDEEDYEDNNDLTLFDTKKFKLKQNGSRFYIALRF